MKQWIFTFLLLGSVFYYYNYLQPEQRQSVEEVLKGLIQKGEYDKASEKVLQALRSSATEEEKKTYRKLLAILRDLERRAAMAIAKKKAPKKESKREEAPLVATSEKPVKGAPMSYEKARQVVLSRPESQEAISQASFVAEQAKRKKDAVGRWAGLSVLYLYGPQASQKQRRQWREELRQLSRELILQPTSRSPLVKIHVVRKGEYLSHIAKRYGCTWEFLMRINGMKRPTVWVGRKIRVIPGTWSILVRKGEFRLYLLLNKLFVWDYPVGLGKDGCTPTGTFVIVTKQKNPTWYWKGRKYPFGHPKNILGTRWMGFQATEKYRGYGIHGTKFPESIGKEASSGCVRMHNRDVEELYLFIRRGVKVTITP